MLTLSSQKVKIKIVLTTRSGVQMATTNVRQMLKDVEDRLTKLEKSACAQKKASPKKRTREEQNDEEQDEPVAKTPAKTKPPKIEKGDVVEHLLPSGEKIRGVVLDVHPLWVSIQSPSGESVSSPRPYIKLIEKAKLTQDAVTSASPTTAVTNQAKTVTTPHAASVLLEEDDEEY